MVARNTLKAMLVTLAVLLPVARAAPAALPLSPRLGPEFQITSDVVVGGQEWYQPDVVYNPNRGLYFVVSHNDLDTGPSIHGQHITQGGTHADWFWTIYGPFEGIEVLQPAVAYNSLDRDYLVVWMYRDTSEGEDYEIWGRIFDEFGRVAGDPFEIFSWANRSFWSPRVAYNAFRNEYFVLWNAFNTSGGSPGLPNDVAGCRISPGGGIVHCPIIVTNSNFPHQADFAYNLVRDEYFVVWVRSYLPSATGNDIYGALLGWNGVKLNPPGEFAIDSAERDQGAPAVAADASGHYMVVWEHSTVSFGRDITGQMFDGFGATVGERLPVGPMGTDASRPAVVDGPGGGEWLAAYQAATATGSAVWAKRWEPTGKWPKTEWISVLDVGLWAAESPAVAVSGAKFLIAYEGHDTGNPTIDQHIYGRMWSAAAVYLPLALCSD